jgi:SAM-dependent methyltransferase
MTLPVWTRRVAQFVRHLDRYVLRAVFGFDLWHVNRLSDRPYARAIVSYLNGLPEERRGAVVEIGCGLGDIIRRLRFRQRIGLDAERGAIRAARLLVRGSFASGLHFAELRFPHTLDGRFDAIIMVNWPHLVDESTLQPPLDAYVREHLKPSGVLIIDTVQDRAYTFNHSITRLAPEGSTVTKLGDFARQREVWVIGQV